MGMKIFRLVIVIFYIMGMAFAYYTNRPLLLALCGILLLYDGIMDRKK